MVVLTTTTVNVRQVTKDRTVCHCFSVKESVISDSIDALGATTVADVSAQTNAGKGCTACHCRIKRMLAGQPAVCSGFAVCAVCDECGVHATLCECKVA
jgi:NAD(P)H-nitrite reductase large subunit